MVYHSKEPLITVQILFSLAKCPNTQPILFWRSLPSMLSLLLFLVFYNFILRHHLRRRASLLSVMWTSWLPSRVHTTPRSRSFSCSSFKDILTISSDQQHDTDSCPASPRSPTIFHRIALPRSSSQNNTFLRSQHTSSEQPPQPRQSIIVYLTSLRVIRKTFEDCRLVLSILRGLGVSIDERDLSMDARYYGF